MMTFYCMRTFDAKFQPVVSKILFSIKNAKKGSESSISRGLTKNFGQF